MFSQAVKYNTVHVYKTPGGTYVYFSMYNMTPFQEIFGERS